MRAAVIGMLDEIEKILIENVYGFTTKYVESDPSYGCECTGEIKLCAGSENLLYTRCS